MPRAQARAQRRSTPSTIRRHFGLRSSSAPPFYRNLAKLTVTRMGNDGFDSSDETGYSSDDGYMFCQRNGCGRSNPWGDPAHCCTLCACWENGKWQTHSIECDADYIRERILRKPWKPGRAGRDLMLLDIRERDAISLRLCKKSEEGLLLKILFRTWVRRWQTSQSYAQYIRTCKFREYMREARDIMLLLILGSKQKALGRLEIVFRSWARMVRMWRQGPRSSSSVRWTRRSLQQPIWEKAD